MGKPATNVRRNARWGNIISDYRHRHRNWVITYCPSMPEDQWKEYTKWVGNFPLGMNGRKMKRNLTKLRNTMMGVQKDMKMTEWQLQYLRTAGGFTGLSAAVKGSLIHQLVQTHTANVHDLLK